MGGRRGKRRKGGGGEEGEEMHPVEIARCKASQDASTAQSLGVGRGGRGERNVT